MHAKSDSASLAVLIDADNAAPSIVEGLMVEIAKYGVASVKRIYGDWTKPNLEGWKKCLLEHSIQPIQQFRYTVGKNATDSAMIIDAMDLLYTARFDGFCLVSSDSDFTRLASRIREQGVVVYGFGERKTPKPFITACDKFVFTDVLGANVAPVAAERPAKASAEGAASAADTPQLAVAPRMSSAELKRDGRLIRLLKAGVAAVSDDDGWASLGGIGSHIAKQAPEFDSRNYGYAKLSDLVAATEAFEISRRGPAGAPKSIWVKTRE